MYARSRQNGYVDDDVAQSNAIGFTASPKQGKRKGSWHALRVR
jgi:hypothetical protein